VYRITCLYLSKLTARILQGGFVFLIIYNMDDVTTARIILMLMDLTDT